MNSKGVNRLLSAKIEDDALRLNNGQAYLVVGEGQPTDGVSGFMGGCLYLRTDGSSNTSLYVNEGDSASTSWAAK